MNVRILLPLVVLFVGPWCIVASEIVEILPLTDRIVMLHFDDGFVVHHTRGQKRSDEKALVNPLDTAAACKVESYAIASADDPAYADALQPTQIGRKSKGTDFGWLVEKWENGRAVNTRPDNAKEHWIYLFLPKPMLRGKTYTVKTGGLAANGKEWTLRFDETQTRSEAVHVNLLGYAPDAPQKFAYVFQWMGDKGSLDLKGYEGRRFSVFDQKSGESALRGKLAFRKPAANLDTNHKSDTPQGSFLAADVYECDLSALTRPGQYVVAVEGIGCSFPFRVDRDVYREAFRTVARGLYHNRSGIELKQPYTEFTRPAPHNPRLTPGFDGKLLYTTLRFTEWGSEGGDAKKLLAASKGPLDAWGWYQDAGDWDSYYTHLRVAQELLFAYELAPRNFIDGELNIPESGNGVPDILDEAAWLPRFCQRLRAELIARRYGAGGVGLRVAGDAFGEDEKTLPDGTKVGQGSWEDVARTWVVSGEDPWSSYRYAGAAAHLAFCLQLAGAKDPEGIDWAKEAAETYAWARQNTLAGDEGKQDPKLSDPRSYAAAALFRLTGDAAYEKQFAADTADVTPTTNLNGDRCYGCWLYALGGGKTKPDAALQRRIRAALIHSTDQRVLGSCAQRALRWAGDLWMPMLIGQQTTPWVLEGAVSYTLLKPEDPEKAQRYRAALYTTCDYFLGCNSLNMTWATGLGPRHPQHVFHMDAWYNGKGRFHPGIIPYGPWRKDRDLGQGPWAVDWPNQTLHPPIDQWPGNERWFDNRCSPMNSEFTVHQNQGPTAAIFGYLCAPKE